MWHQISSQKDNGMLQKCLINRPNTYLLPTWCQAFIISQRGRQKNVTHTKIKEFTWHRGVSDDSCQGESGLGLDSDAIWVNDVIPTSESQRENSFRRANKELCSTCQV